MAEDPIKECDENTLLGDEHWAGTSFGALEQLDLGTNGSTMWWAGDVNKI